MTKHILRLFLTALILIQMGVTVWAGRTGGFAEIVSRMSSPSYKVTTYAEWKQQVNSDPKVGTIMPPKTLLDSDRNSFQLGGNGRPFGIIFIGNCTECALTRLQAWSRLQSTHPEMQLVAVPAYGADVDEVRNYKTRHSLNLRIVIGGGQRLAESCNAYFRPRIYIFGADNELKYIQAPIETTESALATARLLMDQLIRGGGGQRT